MILVNPKTIACISLYHKPRIIPQNIIERRSIKKNIKNILDITEMINADYHKKIKAHTNRL